VPWVSNLTANFQLATQRWQSQGQEIGWKEKPLDCILLTKRDRMAEAFGWAEGAKARLQRQTREQRSTVGRKRTGSVKKLGKEVLH
jgi:hypothetical protein